MCGARRPGSGLRPQCPGGSSHTELTRAPAHHCPRQPQARIQIPGTLVLGTPHLEPLGPLGLPLLLMLASELVSPPALSIQDHDNVNISHALFPWTRVPEASLSSCPCPKPHRQHLSKDPSWMWRCQYLIFRVTPEWPLALS